MKLCIQDNKGKEITVIEQYYHRKDSNKYGAIVVNGTPNFDEVLDKFDELDDKTINDFDGNVIIYDCFRKTNDSEKVLNMVDKYIKYSSINIETTDGGDYFYNIRITGKLLDVYPFYQNLFKSSNVDKYDRCLYYDSQTIRQCIKGNKPPSDYEHNSIIIEFLSNHNAKMGYNDVRQLLRDEINQDEKFKKIILDLFRSIYGIKYESAMELLTKGDDIDKLNLDAISNATLEELNNAFTNIFGGN